MARSSSPKTPSRKRKPSVENVKNKRRKISKESCQESPKKGVIKSPKDPSKYKLLVLPNGVKAILVSTLESSKPSESDLELDECTGELKSVLSFNKRHIQFSPENSSNNTKTKYKDKPSFHKSRDFKTKTKRTQVIRANNPWEYCGLSLSVGSGSCDDPKDLPGMAHLCEHCVLLETKQSGKGVYVPYLKFLGLNGGYGNAFTSLDKTTYLLEAPLTNEDGKCIFEEGIELLVDSIVDPLLCKESIVREINAVDCEYQIGSSSGRWDYWSMILSLAKSNHPLNCFPCGNQKSLGKPRIAERLSEWKEKHYVGNSITLAIQAPLKMNELEKIVVNNFCRISRSSKNAASVGQTFRKNDDPFDTPEFRKVYSIATSSYYNFLYVTWSVPANMSQDFEINPFAYIYYVLNWEQKGSLFHYLKIKGWIIYLGVHVEKSDYCGILTIQVVLTETGLDNYENVVESIFSYLNLMKLRKTDVGIVNDLQRLYLDYFHYSSYYWDLSSVIKLDHAILKGRGIHAITGDRLITKCNPKFVDSVLEKLTPCKANVMLMSRRFMENPNLCEEKWIGVKYFVNDLSDQKIKDWANVRPYREYQLRPQSNKHLTRNLNCPKDEPTRAGFRIIVDDKRAYVVQLAKPCQPGNLPHAHCLIYIVSNSAPTTLNTILLELWTLIINSEIESNDSLSYFLMTTGSSILILVYSDPADILETVLRALEMFNRFEVGLNEETYKFYWNILLNGLRSTGNSERYLLGDVTHFILDQNHDQIERVFETLKGENKYLKTSNSGFEDFLDFIRAFKSQMKIFCGIFGNVSNDHADRISASIIGMPYRHIPGRLSEPQEICMQIPLGQKCIRVFAFKRDESMSVIRNYYEIGYASTSKMFKFYHISIILNTSCFEQLRTVEQLTYAVRAYLTSHNGGVLGIFVMLLVQSQKYSADKIDKRIDEYLKTFYETEFSTESLTRLLKNNSGQTNVDENYVEEMRTLFADYLLPTGKGYRKLSIQISPYPKDKTVQEVKPELSLQYDLPPALVSSDSDYYIRNVDNFKSKLYAYPQYPDNSDTDDE